MSEITPPTTSAVGTPTTEDRHLHRIISASIGHTSWRMSCHLGLSFSTYWICWPCAQDVEPGDSASNVGNDESTEGHKFNPKLVIRTVVCRLCGNRSTSRNVFTCQCHKDLPCLPFWKGTVYDPKSSICLPCGSTWTVDIS
eukprot:2271166-Karenia_brevis.AAC.1